MKKIKISKERILLLVLPIFCLVMFILEIISSKEIFDKVLTLGVVAFMFQLGQNIGSLDEKAKGIDRRLTNLEK